MSLFFRSRCCQSHRREQGRRGLWAVLGLCVALVGCALAEVDSMPPLDALYFPSSIAHIERAGGEEGVLLIANANFDKLYKHGSFIAVDLAELGLPAFGEKPEEPKRIESLGIRPEHALKVSSFAGQMGVHRLADGGVRFFLPSRSEGAHIHVIDMDAPGADGALNIRCAQPGKEARNCAQTALSLTANEKTKTGLPRAPSPGFAVVSEAGDVWLTHMAAADSPADSLKGHVSYAVRLSAQEPHLTDAAFMPIGEFPSDAALPLGAWVLLTGRGNGPVLRMLSTGQVSTQRQARGEAVVVNANIESSLGVSEGRSLLLSSDGKQIFLLGRYPDMLLVLRVSEPTEPTSPPSLHVVRHIPLPEAPNALHILKREGRGDLVAVVSSGSSALSFYDQDAGILTGQLTSLGEGSFGIASSLGRGQGGAGARLFVSNFSEGRIAVVDIEDLRFPQDARVVALIGSRAQICLTRGEAPGCEGAGE